MLMKADQGPVAEAETCLSSAIAGCGSRTTSVAVEVFPVPPFVDVTVTLLFLMPATVPRTFSEKLQVASGFRLAPLRLTVLLPAVAGVVPPPPGAAGPFGGGTTPPAGGGGGGGVPAAGAARARGG